MIQNWSIYIFSWMQFIFNCLLDVITSWIFLVADFVWRCADQRSVERLYRLTNSSRTSNTQMLSCVFPVLLLFFCNYWTGSRLSGWFAWFPGWFTGRWSDTAWNPDPRRLRHYFRPALRKLLADKSVHMIISGSAFSHE